MLDIFVSITIFLLVAGAHILIHNAAASGRIYLPRSIFLFFISGGLLNWMVLNTLPRLGHSGWAALLMYPLPLTATVIYVVISVIYILYSGSAVYGDYSPSAKIYLYLVKRGRATEKELKKLFSDTELVTNRINDLIHMGFVGRKSDAYFVSTKGKFLYILIEIYRRIIGWRSSG
ncbi:hypothetical protein A2Z33_03990 [Candidatus Gottesmanbacteria bacterium RBG_16_52_11]|uniref:Uncharacterized protein n=1 Tax=Candidatus Gottesmanbacteria bacterium RBG_16_52_11 TaxID=1798374 RepID=A0A1F5YW28_9BACT|nr:MAG: hypothetical protein A2Z33_03990 [Candidatus Gottesmanbacteria bacterium RBG_16_52_11]